MGLGCTDSLVLDCRADCIGEFVALDADRPCMTTLIWSRDCAGE